MKETVLKKNKYREIFFFRFFFKQFMILKLKG